MHFESIFIEKSNEYLVQVKIVEVTSRIINELKRLESDQGLIIDGCIVIVRILGIKIRKEVVNSRVGRDIAIIIKFNTTCLAIVYGGKN